MIPARSIDAYDANELMSSNRYTSHADLARYYGFDNSKDFKEYETRNAMTKIYRMYYALWVDFDILLSFFALYGLAFNLVSYNYFFYQLHKPRCDQLSEETQPTCFYRPTPTQWPIGCIPVKNYSGKDKYNSPGYDTWNMFLLIVCFACGLFRQYMRSYWVKFREPMQLLKVLQMQKEKNETLNRNRGLIKSSVRSFYFSKTFIVEMAILAIQPWPGSNDVIIDWKQPNWGGDET